ncbi:hypothetical protein ABT030_32115 [Streptomyces mirabilis]|uniref:hypothetical protein n=1 Tax=Streptomyces mirabilis TaxID=68239 RepID=UPI00331D3F70
MRQAIESQIEGMELLRAEDIADAVSYIVTRDHRVAVDEILVRAGEDRANPPCAAGIAGGSRRPRRHGRIAGVAGNRPKMLDRGGATAEGTSPGTSACPS